MDIKLYLTEYQWPLYIGVMLTIVTGSRIITYCFSNYKKAGDFARRTIGKKIDKTTHFNMN